MTNETSFPPKTDCKPQKPTFEGKTRKLFNGVTRRNFLKIMGIVAGEAVLPRDTRPVSAAKLEQAPRTPELELPKDEWISYLDISSEVTKNLVEFLNSQMSLALDLENLQPDQPIDQERLLSDDQYALTQLLASIKKTYASHNQVVQVVTDSVLRDLGGSRELAPSPVYPVENAIREAKFNRDSFGNPILSFSLSPELVSNFLQKADQFIAVLPFLMGKNSISLQLQSERDPKQTYIEYSIQGETLYSPEELLFFADGSLETSIQDSAQNLATQPGHATAGDHVAQIETTLNSDYGQDGEWYSVAQTEIITSDNPEYQHLLAQSPFLSIREYTELLPTEFFDKDKYQYQTLGQESGYYQRMSRANPRIMRNLAQLEYDQSNEAQFPAQLTVRKQITASDLLTQEQYDQLQPVLTQNEHPLPNITEGYQGENAYQGLKDMYYVASHNPDKLIVAAAGNYGSFFDQAMKQLELEGEIKPPNLILVGFYISTNQASSYRPDIYFDRNDFESSSESSGALGGILLLIAQQLLNRDDYKLLSLTEQKTRLITDLPIEISKYTDQLNIDSTIFDPNSSENSLVPVSVINYQLLSDTLR